ncbi:MAG: phosphatase PAP2 family protein [Salinivirgaceae bacterium]
MGQKSKSAFFFLLLTLISSGLFSQSGFPYTYKTGDYVLLPVGVGLSLYNLTHNNPAKLLSDAEIQNLSASSVNRFDRLATTYWNPGADRFSDVLTLGFVSAPALLLIPSVKNREYRQAAILGLMYAEVVLLTYGLTEFTKNRDLRIRPYMYNSGLSLNEKQDLAATGDARRSFYSLHAALVFGTAVFASKTVIDWYGWNSRTRWVVAGTGCVALSVSALRFYSGQHFPTDIVTGALVGGLIGYVVPLMHKKEGTKVSFNFLGNSFRLAYRL